MEALYKRIAENLRAVEAAPGIEIKTGAPGTRQDPSGIKFKEMDE